jgi:hypothetical protein
MNGNWHLVFFVASTVMILFLFISKHNEFGWTLSISCCIFLILANGVINLYVPYKRVGKLLNSIVVTVKIEGSYLSIETPQTKLFTSRQIEWKLTDLAIYENRGELMIPQIGKENVLILKHSGDETQGELYLMKDFFDDFDLLFSKLYSDVS